MDLALQADKTLGITKHETKVRGPIHKLDYTDLGSARRLPERPATP